jgi:hypothetical protein
MVYTLIETAYGPSYAMRTRVNVHGVYPVPYERDTYGYEALTLGGSAPRDYHTIKSAYSRQCRGYGVRACTSDRIIQASTDEECGVSMYGCCSDGKTVKLNAAGSNCPETFTLPEPFIYPNY